MSLCELPPELAPQYYAATRRLSDQAKNAIIVLSCGPLVRQSPGWCALAEMRDPFPKFFTPQTIELLDTLNLLIHVWDNRQKVKLSAEGQRYACSILAQIAID